MDIKTLAKKLDISWVKVALYAVFSPARLYELALDKVNTAANMLLEANAEAVQVVRERLAVLSGYLAKGYRYLPESWAPYCIACNDAAKAVYAATGDNKITAEERADIIDRFRVAYSAFKAD